MTAIQVSAKGMAFLKTIPVQWCAEIDRVIFGDRRRVGGQLRVRFDGKQFGLSTRGGEESRTSTVTQTEDVSYVSSAFLPQVRCSAARDPVVARWLTVCQCSVRTVIVPARSQLESRAQECSAPHWSGRGRNHECQGTQQLQPRC